MGRWSKRFAELGIRFDVHFIPTRSSWLHVIERFFRDLDAKRLRPGQSDEPDGRWIMPQQRESDHGPAPGRFYIQRSKHWEGRERPIRAMGSSGAGGSSQWKPRLENFSLRLPPPWKGSARRISIGIRAGPARSRMRSPATHHRNSPPEGSSRPLLNAALRDGRQEECGADRYRSAPQVDTRRDWGRLRPE